MEITLQKNSTRSWIIATLLITAVTALAFLPHIQQLGYYRDDWNLIYAGYTQGAEKLIDIYSVDRPFIGYLFAWIFYPAFGESAIGWNISAYLIRLAGALSFFWLLRLLWPRQEMPSLVAGLLFAVFPGFLQQPNGIQYQPHLLNMTAAILSIALSIRALHAHTLPARILLVVGALLLGTASMFMMEYYIGLEVVRLVLLWYATRPGETKKWFSRARRVVLRWLPYAGSVCVFLFWRAFLFKSQRAGADIGQIIRQFGQSPVYQLLNLTAEWLKDVFEVAILSWWIPSYQLISTARLRDFLIALSVGVAASILVMIVYRFARWGKTAGLNALLTVQESPTRDMAIVGLAWVVVTSFPIILAGREVTFSLSLDRFTFPGSAGAALMVAGLLFWAGRGGVRFWLPLGMITLAVMTHNINGINYANHWNATRNFWWQLSWRAPEIERDTVLVALISGAPVEEDYEIWGPANMIYYPEAGPLGIQSEVLNTRSVQDILMGGTSERIMRTIEVERDYSHTLVVSMPGIYSCVHVLDGQRVELSQSDDFRIQLIASHSNIQRIRPDGESHLPPAGIFGAEPLHGWCYYYQKAALARQEGYWDEVVRLGNEARNRGLRASDWMEWFPFLQAYAYTGNEDAAGAILPIIKENSFVNYQACLMLNREKERLRSNSQEWAGNQFLLEKLCGASP